MGSTVEVATDHNGRKRLNVQQAVEALSLTYRTAYYLRVVATVISGKYKGVVGLVIKETKARYKVIDPVLHATNRVFNVRKSSCVLTAPWEAH